MRRTVFYSWQSDLPNSTNRSFIESCLKLVISKVGQKEPLSVELAIDRDTKDTPGTPEIVDTIFKKIDDCCLFIADISIINKTSESRKCPNPNVLVELGYAAKSIGWERIICIYNKDFGSFEDLPFDLRQRRPLAYSLEDNTKDKVRNNIVDAVISTINSLNDKGLLYDELQDYLKVQVDTQILTIIKHLYRSLCGYEAGEFTLGEVNYFLGLTKPEIISLLSNNTHMGFQVFKQWHVIESDLRDIVDKTISSNHYKKEIIRIAISIIRWLGRWEKFNSYRIAPDMFINSGKVVKGYTCIPPDNTNKHNEKVQDRFILLRKLDKQHGQVVDFGDFIEKHRIQKLLAEVKLNPKYLEMYVANIAEFIETANSWLDITNGEFILDTNKAFEIRGSNPRMGQP